MKGLGRALSTALLVGSTLVHPGCPIEKTDKAPTRQGVSPHFPAGTQPAPFKQPEKRTQPTKTPQQTQVPVSPPVSGHTRQGINRALKPISKKPTKLKPNSQPFRPSNTVKH